MSKLTESTPLTTSRRRSIFQSSKWIGSFIALLFLLNISTFQYPIRPSLFSSCDPKTNTTTGYLSLPQGEFYYLFAQHRYQSPSVPLLVYFTGGPGCSSLTALLTESGPCLLQDNTTLAYNPIAWNSIANVLYLDIPAGVGFSTPHNTTSNLEETLYEILQHWFQQHPQYRHHPVYLFSESFGGHFVISLASYIVQRNVIKHIDAPEALFVQLAGIGIGSGFLDPLSLYGTLAEMLERSSYVSLNETFMDQMKRDTEQCLSKIRICQQQFEYNACRDAKAYCNRKLYSPMFQSSHRNPYDLRQSVAPGEPYYADITTKVTQFLNQPLVQQKLHVFPTQWTECNADIPQSFTKDWMKSYVNQLPLLLNAGVHALIYNGNADYMCNYIGTEKWIHQLFPSFNASQLSAFDQGGWFYNHENQFIYLRVTESGHIVPYDQPAVTLRMLEYFLKLHET